MPTVEVTDIELIPCDEKAGSPTMRYGIGNSSATRQARIPWNLYPKFVAAMFPATTVGRHFPGDESMRAVSISVVPEGDKIVGPDPAYVDNFKFLNEYRIAVVTVEYETTEFVDPGTLPIVVDGTVIETPEGEMAPFLVHDAQAGGEFLTIPTKGLEWRLSTPLGTEVREEVNAADILVTVEHTVTWPRHKNPPFDEIRQALGCVNDEYVLFQTGNVPPECLLFTGVEFRREVLANGTRAWTLVYHFSERCKSADAIISAAHDVPIHGFIRITWNHFFHTEDTFACWERLAKKNPDGSLSDIFQQVSFADLLFKWDSTSFDYHVIPA